MARYVESGYWEVGYAEGDTVVISPNSCVHSHAADQVTVTSDGVLTINDADHAHTADNITVASGAVLTINSANHSHAADQPTISAQFSLAINAADHSHSAEQVVVVSKAAIGVNDGTHGHAAQSPPVTYEATQLLVAIADNSNTDWKRSDTGATSNLFPLLDEGDEDSIYCTEDGAIANFQFTSALQPNRDTDHDIRYRISGDGVSNLTVRLKNGGTTIATWVETAPGTTPQTIVRTLTVPQAEAITDYTDLRLEFEETA